MASSTLTSAPSMATAAASSMVTAWVTVSGIAPDGQPATTTVPYMDPFAFINPPTNDMVIMNKFGDHEYNIWSLTNNPFFTTNEECTIGTCNLILSYTHYFPAQGPTLFLLAFFGLAALYHLPISIWRKMWGFGVGMVVGCGLEVAGYAGRYMQRSNPWSQDAFLLNIICLTIGPAFLTASVYLCLARIINAYGADNARFRPAVYTTTFMVADFISLVLQGAGGGLASSADPDTPMQKGGVNTMIAGLVFQVVSLLFFIILCADFAICTVRGKAPRNEQFRGLTSSLKWKAFLFGLAVATVTIFVRCCYRVAELSRGFASDLAHDETLFGVLESAMIALAVLALSVAHPAFVFGRTWAEADFSLRRGRGRASSLDATTVRPKLVPAASDASQSSREPNMRDVGHAA